jgi:hypothetical protein
MNSKKEKEKQTKEGGKNTNTVHHFNTTFIKTRHNNIII